jgi:hypothetical protein
MAAGGQYSTNLDRNRYGNDDNYLFTGGCTAAQQSCLKYCCPPKYTHGMPTELLLAEAESGCDSLSVLMDSFSRWHTYYKLDKC